MNTFMGRSGDGHIFTTVDGHGIGFFLPVITLVHVLVICILYGKCIHILKRNYLRFCVVHDDEVYISIYCWLLIVNLIIDVRRVWRFVSSHNHSFACTVTGVMFHRGLFRACLNMSCHGYCWIMSTCPSCHHSSLRVGKPCAELINFIRHHKLCSFK